MTVLLCTLTWFVDPKSDVLLVELQLRMFTRDTILSAYRVQKQFVYIPIFLSDSH